MKNASTEDRYSYVFTNEYEIFEWNMGHVANYAELSRPGECEIAVVVAHEQHERGVGTALLKALGHIARDAGQHRFVADVLFENYAMRRVLHDAGWPMTQHRDGPVLSIELDIDATEAPTP